MYAMAVIHSPSTSTPSRQVVLNDVVSENLELSSSSKNEEVAEEEVEAVAEESTRFHNNSWIWNAFYDYPLHELVKGTTYLAQLHGYDFLFVTRQRNIQRRKISVGHSDSCHVK
ncbi:hypothetical protein CHS0354_040238 [Potamilus streckersoni]|uniref:Uncharacterized protein n=1 Tax=Potamilus streckersoni TaxID=2493646 RepID=A0AAE0S4L6_9BIVA|nr:hypothetical protein CHS0354_040238 [Potamilus streckersoni]